MTNAHQPFPPENQWDLLAEHGRGLDRGYHALWVETDDQEDLAARFRVDLDSRLECDVETLARTYKGRPAKAIWIGSHAPGWTHLFVFGMTKSYPAITNLGKRRVFDMQYTGDVGEGLSPLYLIYDGEVLGDANPPYEEGGYMSLPDYRPFTEGLAFDPEGDDEHDVHVLWCVIGRITGRFADQEWWTASRTFYSIPAEAWTAEQR
ncbi:hypothetical protein ABZ897_49870 [Nonomuraea sp. NPDC046802]|uniref:hypothetical protein n=1 Tax=Nonomuraea sp. NPDC046802 TaxID=3154919 RepID=UPI0033F13D0F